MELEGEPAGNCPSGFRHIGVDHAGITCSAGRMLTVAQRFMRKV